MEKLDNSTKEQLLEEIKQLKNKVAELEKSELKSKLWLENSPVCTKIVDLDFNLQYMSSSGVRDLKIEDITEFYGKPYPLHFYPDSFKIPMTNNLKKAKETGNTIVQEASVVDVDGNKLWYHSTIVPVYDDKGKLDYIMVVSLETTERKHAEEKLQTQAKFIDNLIESSALSTWISDEKGTAIKANPACLDFFGATEDEVVGKYNLFKDEVLIKQGFIPELKKVFEKGEAVNVIIDYNFGDVGHVEVKNATHKVIKSVFTPIFDKNSKVINAICQTMDLTDIKRAEEAVREGEKKLRSLLNNIDAGVVVHAPDTSILLNNPRASELLGLSQEQMIGKQAIDPEWKFINENNTPFSLEEYPVNRIVKSKAPIKNLTLGVIHSKTSDIVWLLVNGFPVLDKNDDIVEIIINFVDITELKQVGKEIQKSNSILSSVINSPSNIIMFALDQNYNYLSFNKAHVKEMKAIYGVDIELGKHIFSYMPNKEDTVKAEINYKRVLKGERFLEIQEYGDANNRFWYELIFNPIIDLANLVTGFTVFVTNITERKLAEDKIVRFSRIFEDSLNEIYLFDADSLKFTQVNSTAQKNLGYSMEEFLNMTPLDFKPNFTAESFAKLVNPLRKNKKEKIVFGTVHQRKDKSQYHVEVHLQLMQFENEKIFVAIILDITERNQAEEELKKSKERYDLAMMATKDGVFDWDLIGNEIYYSPGWKSMLGYEDNELPNDFSVWEKLTEPEHVKKSWKMQNEVINKKRDRFEMEFKMKHKDGYWVDIASRAEAIFDESGKAVRMVGTHIDITERKNAEEELRKHRDDLEQMVNERTAEVDEKNKKLSDQMKVFVGREQKIRDLEIRLRAMRGE